MSTSKNQIPENYTINFNPYLLQKVKELIDIFYKENLEVPLYNNFMPTKTAPLKNPKLHNKDKETGGEGEGGGTAKGCRVVTNKESKMKAAGMRR